MGAVPFFNDSSGPTLKEAFSNSVQQAQHMHGHGGYSGTIAEKSSVTEIPRAEVPDSMNPIDYARQLIDEDDSRVSDKWGPAGAIKLESNDESNQQTWLLFGWASS